MSFSPQGRHSSSCKRAYTYGQKGKAATSGRRHAMARSRTRKSSVGPPGHLPRSKKALSPRKADSFNVTELHVSGHVRRVGNSLAVLIPIAEARKAGISTGDPVDVLIRSGVPDAFGLLKGLPYVPFERRRRGLWRDRI